MQYTLDSVVHVVACLQQEYKDSEITYEPVFITEALDLNRKRNKNKIFFGVLTTGRFIVRLEREGRQIIEVAKNSQIVEVFDSIRWSESLDDIDSYWNENDAKYDHLHFRGFEIEVKGEKLKGGI